MSENTENEATPIAQPSDEGVEQTSFFEDLASMLDALVPPKEILVTDVHGKEHRLPGAISARKQVVVFREFQSVWGHEKVRSHLDSASDFAVTSIINAVIGISFEEGVLDSLGRAFHAAFPGACDGDPLDHFAVEEVVAALVPLFLRFVKRAGKTLVGIGEATVRR